MNKQESKSLGVAMRAKVGVIWLQTNEELRVERAATLVATQLNYKVATWTATKGVRLEGDFMGDETRDPANALNTLLKMGDRITLIMFDPSPWFKDPLALRTLKDTQREIPGIEKSTSKQVIVIDANDPPNELTGATVINVGMPDRTTMEQVLDSFLEFAPESAKTTEHNENRDKVIQSMLGLTTESAANALSRSLAEGGTFNPDLISREKQRVVRGSGLEWYEPDPRGMNGVGGMENLKDWLAERRRAFSEEARKWGLPAPKGAVLLGVPGGGKSLTCKCIASTWGIPLLRMDLGSLFSKYVGESEGKIRAALQTAEAVAPCILWLDEIEKAMGQGGSESDGGTSQRVFGAFLTWMQERKPGVFIVATANDLRPFESNPEFLRAGRWDEIWFVDLPNTRERTKISTIMGSKFPHCSEVDPQAVALASNGYTGAEIESAFNDALYAAFDVGSNMVSTEDVLFAIKKRVPLSKTMGDKIAKLQKWASGRARFASPPDLTESTKTTRNIE